MTPRLAQWPATGGRVSPRAGQGQRWLGARPGRNKIKSAAAILASAGPQTASSSSTCQGSAAAPSALLGSPGGSTTPHHHVKTEEIYYILEGRGRMRVGQETLPVGPGDAIAIPPGVSHQIDNTSAGVLKFLCCCAPGYEHEDTTLESDTHTEGEVQKAE